MAAKRIESVHVEREADEILVMKASGTWEAHALNQAAAAVYDLCDGQTSKAEMAVAIQRRTGLPADEEIVDLALAGLADAELVTLENPETCTITRRALVQRLGLTSAAVALLPVVETILVPPASAQGSPTATQTQTAIATATETAIPTATQTATATATETATVTATGTATGTATQTATASATATRTRTPSPTPTQF